MHGGCVASVQAGKIPAAISLIVETEGVQSLFEALSSPERSGIAQVSVSGNVVAFAAGGQSFLVKCLPREGFDAELAVLGDASQARFAHDGLQWHPGALRAEDPLRCASRVRLMQPSPTPDAALGDLMEGLIASASFSLALDPSFRDAQTKLLTRTSLSESESGATAAGFLRALPALASVTPAGTVAALLRSPLLTSAFAASGVRTARIVGAYGQLRNRRSGTTDAALWLAAISLQKPGILRSGAIDHSTPLRRQICLKALSQAARIV